MKKWNDLASVKNRFSQTISKIQVILARIRSITYKVSKLHHVAFIVYSMDEIVNNK